MNINIKYLPMPDASAPRPNQAIISIYFLKLWIFFHKSSKEKNRKISIQLAGDSFHSKNQYSLYLINIFPPWRLYLFQYGMQLG